MKGNGRRQGRRGILRAMLGTALVVAGASACSLLLTRGNIQCVTTSDCPPIGPEFVSSICNTNDGVCALLDAGIPCAKNSECAFAAGDSHAICDQTRHVCVDLLSKECPQLTGVVKDDSVIVFGTMGELTGPSQSSGVAQRNAVDLAIDEISRTVVGVPVGTARPRPLAFVSCDDSAPDGGAIAAANHLVNDVKVFAIVGPGNSQNTIDVKFNVTIPNNVLLIAPSATADALSNTKNNGLVWRIAPPDTYQAQAINSLVSGLATALHPAGSASLARVAIVFRDDVYGHGLHDDIVGTLVVNGLPVTASGYASSLQQTTYPTSGVVSSLVPSIVAFAPEIVVIIGTNEAATQLVTPIEAAWPTAAGAPAPPAYVLSDGVKQEELLAAIGNNDKLRGRIRGTVPGRVGPLTQAFFNRFKVRFPLIDPTGFGTAGAYDAAYLLFYAMVSAAGTGALTGPSLGDAMKLMSSGGEIDVGATASLAGGQNPINAAIAQLTSKNPINFNGASGPLDFDNAKGFAPSDIDVWCVARDGSGAASFASSGQYYSIANGLQGTFSCP